MLYQFGTVYRSVFPYIKNINLCALIKNWSSHQITDPLSNLLINCIIDISEKFKKGCPFHGFLNETYIDPNLKITDLLPPIVPEGD